MLSWFASSESKSQISSTGKVKWMSWAETFWPAANKTYWTDEEEEGKFLSSRFRTRSHSMTGPTLLCSFFGCKWRLEKRRKRSPGDGFILWKKIRKDRERKRKRKRKQRMRRNVAELKRNEGFEPGTFQEEIKWLTFDESAESSKTSEWDARIFHGVDST